MTVKPELRPWIMLAVFSLLGFLINASTFAALGGILPHMVADLGWNWFEAGLGFTILGAACGSSSFVPTILIRRFGVRATLALGAGVMIAGFYCLSAAHGLVFYFLGAALAGVGYQMASLIPGTHVLAAVFKHRALPFGVYFTTCALGGVAGPLVVSAFHGHWRGFWQAQMAATLVVGLISVALVGGPRWLEQAAARTDREVADEVAEDAAGQASGVARAHARVYRTPTDWTVRDAVRTPQFYVLLAAYFGHLLVGATVSGSSVAHLTERGVSSTAALGMLSLESLVQVGGRAIGGVFGDRIDPRYLLIFALASLVVGSAALSVASDYPMMLIYAVGSGLGFGLTSLAVTVLLLNYFGRAHNLELFSLTCLVGAVSSLGPTLGGFLRDTTGGFGSTFQIYAAVIGVVLLAALLMRPPRARSLDAGEGGQPAMSGGLADRG